MKKKVCKSCKAFYEGPQCPMCKSSQTATSWQGRLSILSKDSKIAKKIGIEKQGEYAIKVR